MAPSRYLNQCLIIVNRSEIFIREDTYGNVVYMANGGHVVQTEVG